MGKFVELASVDLGENKRLVVSKNSNGQVSIAQELTFNSDGKTFKMFVKNAIKCDVECLGHISEAIKTAIEQLKK